MNKNYVAFLRGINVGGHKKVEMKRLKQVFESLGYSDVSTYINSGNVLFGSAKPVDAHPARIEKALEKEFGFHIPVVVRSSKNVIKLSEEIPSTWTNDSTMKTDILFLWDEFDSEDSLAMISVTPKVDTLLYQDGAIVWSVDRSQYPQSGMHKFIGTTLYKHMTARNIHTVRKLAALLQS